MVGGHPAKPSRRSGGVILTFTEGRAAPCLGTRRAARRGRGVEGCRIAPGCAPRRGRCLIQRSRRGAYSAEISVSGRLIYGYNWLVSRLNAGAGWYRLTFSLDADCPFPLNTSLAAAVKGPQPALLTYDPVILPASNLTWIDVYIAQR